MEKTFRERYFEYLPASGNAPNSASCQPEKRANRHTIDPVKQHILTIKPAGVAGENVFVAANSTSRQIFSAAKRLFLNPDGEDTLWRFRTKLSVIHKYLWLISPATFARTLSC